VIYENNHPEIINLLLDDISDCLRYSGHDNKTENETKQLIIDTIKLASQKRPESTYKELISRIYCGSIGDYGDPLRPTPANYIKYFIQHEKNKYNEDQQTAKDKLIVMARKYAENKKDPEWFKWFKEKCPTMYMMFEENKKFIRLFTDK
jgi:hypothetical protein